MLMLKSLTLAALLILNAPHLLAAEQTMQLSSPTFSDGATLPMQHVFNSFGCTGDNQSPALSWTAPPQGTKSLAITAYDPDAPTGSGWWHWVVFNLPASTRDLPVNAGTPDGKNLPQGAVQARTDYGTPGFGGACPPKGDTPHRYIFTVWALDTEALPLDANASGAMVGFYLNQHKIANATLTATYGR
jgi:Raf kinase inhibitor-like YbhB/YbcL family protein